MKLIRPKNWAEFQHYKDRSPQWIKLHKRLLDDFEYQTLPVASRALAPMLWLLASEYDDGDIPSDTRKIAFRLRMTLDELSVGFEPLLRRGFFEIIGEDDEDASNTLAESEPIASLEKEIQVTSKTQVKTEKRRTPSAALPEWIPSEAWNAFVEMRMRSKAPLTARAKELAVADLVRLRDEGHAPLAVLEQSTMRSWRGLFPVEDANARGKSNSRRESSLEQAHRIANELANEDSSNTLADHGEDYSSGNALPQIGYDRRRA